MRAEWSRVPRRGEEERKGGGALTCGAGWQAVRAGPTGQREERRGRCRLQRGWAERDATLAVPGWGARGLGPRGEAGVEELAR